MAKDLRYIFNMPIEISGIGKIHPFTLQDYIEREALLSILSVTINSVLQTVDPKDAERRKRIEEELKIFDVLISEQHLLDALCDLLYYTFKADNIMWNHLTQQIKIEYADDEEGTERIIDRNNFDGIREQIIKSNNLQFTKQAKTKELQEWFDKKNKLNNSSDSDMEDTITSIMAFTGYTSEQILKLSLYQINKIIKRLIKISEYETNVQFRCVSTEEIKIEHWSCHIGESDQDNSSVPFENLTSSMDGIINGKK